MRSTIIPLIPMLEVVKGNLQLLSRIELWKAELNPKLFV